ncbi:MAG: hypothetical protein KDD66_09465 [Bdellovibrionales bacterium]|nr:hypothetical protein [Bdellovibrionales bacterium]
MLKRSKQHRDFEDGAVMYEYVIVAAVMVTGLLTGIYLLQANLCQTFSAAGSAVGWAPQQSSAQMTA